MISGGVLALAKAEFTGHNSEENICDPAVPVRVV